MDERRRGWISDGLTTIMQQEYYTAGGQTSESVIAKDPCSDLFEPSKFMKRCQLIIVHNSLILLNKYI